MTLEQAKLLRKQARALYTADANLRSAADTLVVQAAGEYVNAKKALEATLASVA
jgi:hypothetical protein